MCVPEKYVREIVRAYHFLNSHIRVEKLIKGIKLEVPDPTEKPCTTLPSESNKGLRSVRPVIPQLGRERQV